MFHRPKQEEETQVQPAAETAIVEKEEAAPMAADYNKVLPGLAESQPSRRIFEAKQEATTSYKKPEGKMNEEFSMDRATETARPAERSAFPAMPSAMQMQQQKPRPFAPAYPGSMSSPYGGSAADTAAAEARRLIIGRGITMSGEIESCDHLIVEGSVEAALKGANLLEISESGVFYGTVEIEQATIAGRFEGDLVVSGRLTVRSTGSVTGTIVYKELAVEAGATVDGKINPISGSAVAGGKKKETKKIAPRNDNATEGHELPLGGQAAVG